MEDIIMTKTISAIAAALVASASFTSVALAEGNYYEGTTRDAYGSSVDRNSTGSITARDNGRLPFNNGGSRDNRESGLNSGDYYDGAHRPN
jgi:Protein of unknown function (DUF680).